MPYFVTIKHTRGNAYLYVMHSAYVNYPDGSRRKTQRVVRSFGRVEPLLKKDPMFVEKLRMMYPNRRLLKKLKLEQEAALKEQQGKPSKATGAKVTKGSKKASKANKKTNNNPNKN